MWQGGVPICMTVTLLDGLVLARSTFHHSMNYRSCVILGTGKAVTDLEEKRAVLEAIVEHIVPGRNAEARPLMSICIVGTSSLYRCCEHVTVHNPSKPGICIFHMSSASGHL